MINQTLAQNRVLLLIKPHQSQEMSFIKVSDYSNICIITNSMLENNKVQLYSLLSQVDALITDYSSIYHEKIQRNYHQDLYSCFS